ncbi:MULTISPECIES: D-arabinono-1,4-lactone oxidase [Mycobacteriaceae]|uniref:FAD-binding protein n=1 Tax=Mycolicibacterium mucogenicum DSM 44124 TaxID=1226753 RepID=A0A8H2PFT9_MYCMU|nr:MULTISPECIES: D-arabinono-1,4-lactone oxidase [Mycobacteriaceae]KAB7758364.1 FAD-linked oxidoreductase [Mycolicibacterium mucogenicum DSM 44124]QPG71790.1 FAD-binding protein [Mycolicibacterium mucogenicum DSM 44124]SEB20695.1 FAD-linked oxidoreductase [Mycobacterium sp. 283mftsu]
MTWTNWGRCETANPTEVLRPNTIEAVCDAVVRATATGRLIKVVGSGHSFTGIAVAPDIQLDLGALAGVISVDRERKQVTVGGGTPLWQLTQLLARHGLALENMGDIDRQTISGAISTGTHGTGLAFGGLATQVVGLTLVSGTGELVRIDEEQSSELLPAARVGLGALGIIVEVTLQCVSGFAIHAIERVEPVDDVVATFDERCTHTDHFEFFWFPHTDTAFTKANIRLPAYTPLESTNRVSQWVEEELIENGVLGAICAVGSALPSTVPTLNRTVTRFLSDREHTQRSDRVFTSPRRVRFREMEYAVPYESMGAAFDEVRSLIAERDWRIGFPIEVRAAAEDENWLSTAYGRRSAYIAVHRYVRDDPTEYFRAVEQIMRRYDGRPHWGKMHGRTAADLRDTYPRFDDFLAVREKLDPRRTFANDYLHQVLGE